jgi:hypothetical protein
MMDNENGISNRYIADMKRIHNDLYDIRDTLKGIKDNDLAADIANNISTYDIARNIDMENSIDVEDVVYGILEGMNIEAMDFTTVHEKIDRIEKLITLIREEKWGPEYWR